MVDDIYALIHHIAVLEEENEDLQAEAREKNAWVDFLSLGGDSLDYVRELAESDADRAEFTDMVRIAGDIASNIADGAIGQQKRNLLTVAQYALAWLAELIEKEEA